MSAIISLFIVMIFWFSSPLVFQLELAYIVRIHIWSDIVLIVPNCADC